MKRFTTFLMGLLLLAVGCLGFLGCSDNNAPSNTVQGQGTPITASASFTPPVVADAITGPTATNASIAAFNAATTQPPAGVTAIAKITYIKITPPTGYTLSLPTTYNQDSNPNPGEIIVGAGTTTTGTNGATAGQISPAHNALPLTVDTSGDVVFAPNAAAELPAGNLSFTFPSITMSPATSARTRTRTTSGPATKTCTFSGISVNFTVFSSTGNPVWTLPTKYNLIAVPENDGFFTLSGALAYCIWQTAALAPAKVSLTNVQLQKWNATQGAEMVVTTLGNKTYSPANGSATIDITSGNTQEFDTIFGALFNFENGQ